MGNIISYLKWRGDIGFAEKGFCDADNLVLAALAYVDLSGIVPEKEGQITVCEAAGRYFGYRMPDKENTCESVLYYMAQSVRFSKAVLSRYREKKDEKALTQYASLQIALEDGTNYLAFRGTDDSIVGWREDFSISYTVVPAQKEAAEFLKEAIGLEDRPCRVGGHSKGGNLAVYGAMMCPPKIQEKILCVYNNDGPGICSDMLDEEGYGGIRDKIVRIIPGFSVIGMLFAPKITPVIVKSSANGLIQHDILTWQMEGDALCILPEPEEKSRFYNQIFDQWIASADMEQREIFTRDFFDALEADGARNISEITEGGLDGFGTILLSIVESESRTKIVIGKFLKSFWENIRRIDLKESLRSKEGLRSMLIFAAGMILMLAPELALQGIGTVVSLLALGWSGKKIMDCALQDDTNHRRKKKRLLTYMAILAVAVFFATHHSVLLVSGNLIIGAGFLLFSAYLLKMVPQSGNSRIKKYGLTLTGILLFFIGCVSFATPDRAFAPKMVTMGSVFILYSLGSLLARIYRSGKDETVRQKR